MVQGPKKNDVFMSTKIYLTNSDLVKELIISKALGRRTPQLDKMFLLLATKTINKMTYNNIEDKKDCLMSGLLRMMTYWRSFDEEKYDNAFAFFTQIFKHEIASEFNRLHNKDRMTGTYMKILSLNYNDDAGRNFDRI